MEAARRFACRQLWMSAAIPGSGTGLEFLRDVGCTFHRPLRLYTSPGGEGGDAFQGVVLDSPVYPGSILIEVDLSSCVLQSCLRRTPRNGLASEHHAAARTLARHLLRTITVKVPPVTRSDTRELVNPLPPTLVELTVGLMLAALLFNTTFAAGQRDERLAKLLSYGARLNDRPSFAMWQFEDDQILESSMWQQAHYVAFEEAVATSIATRTQGLDMGAEEDGPEDLAVEARERLLSDAAALLFPFDKSPASVDADLDIGDNRSDEQRRVDYTLAVEDSLRWGCHAARQRTFLTPVTPLGLNQQVFAPVVDLVRPVPPTQIPSTVVEVDILDSRIRVKAARSLQAGEELTRSLILPRSSFTEHCITAAVNYGVQY